MKTKLVKLATLVVAFFSIFTGSIAFAGISSPVTLEAFANADAPVSETGGTMTTSTVGISVADAPGKTAVYFGARLNLGENGPVTITSIEYTFFVNEVVGLDGLNNPIENKSLAVYNPPGDSTLPDVRGFNLSNGVTKSSGLIANSSISGTAKILVEQQVFALNGTTRRPYMTATGHSYGIGYRVRGSFNSTPFDLTAISKIVVLPLAPTPISVSDLQANQITLNWGDVVGETGGFRVESSTDNSVTWQQVSVVPANTLTQIITGLQVHKNYTFRVFAINAGGDSASSPELMLPKVVINSVTAGGLMSFAVTGYGDITSTTDFNVWTNVPTGNITGNPPSRTVSLQFSPTVRGFVRVENPRNPPLPESN